MSTVETDLLQLIERIDANWDAFRQSYEGLSDEEMLEPGVTGSWSVRDILAHVAVWDALVRTVLPGILETGHRPEYDEANEDLGAFNARMTEEKRGLSLDQVRQELEQNHQRLMEYLRDVAPDEVAANEAFRERLTADTWDHYPEHSAAIRDWRNWRNRNA